jgi:hypothetical protein
VAKLRYTRRAREDLFDIWAYIASRNSDAFADAIYRAGCARPGDRALACSISSDLMLTVLGGLAEFERELIRAGGRSRNKARGVYMEETD